MTARAIGDGAGGEDEPDALAAGGAASQVCVVDGGAVQSSRVDGDVVAPGAQACHCSRWHGVPVARSERQRGGAANHQQVVEPGDGLNGRPDMVTGDGGAGLVVDGLGRARPSGQQHRERNAVDVEVVNEARRRGVRAARGNQHRVVCADGIHHSRRQCRPGRSLRWESSEGHQS